VDVQASTEVDSPIGDVWRFYAVEHVRNHLRWDPDMHLEPLSDGPIGLGTRIRRVNTRWARRWKARWRSWSSIRNVRSASRSTTRTWTIGEEPRSRSSGPARTHVTVTTGIEGMDDPENLEFLTRMMQRSVDNVKRLVETEIDSGEA